MIDVRRCLSLGEGGKVKSQAYPLHELNQLGRIELVAELRLPCENDAQGLLLGGLDARQQAYLFEHAVTQVLGFIDDQQNLAPIDMLFHQELIQRRQDFRLLHVEGRKTELHQDGLQERRRRQLGLVDLCDDGIGLQFAQESLDQGGLAGADFTGYHDETVGKPDRRLHVRLGARVLLAQVQELRVRTQAERQFMEFEEF